MFRNTHKPGVLRTVCSFAFKHASCYAEEMTAKALDIAISKAQQLPDSVQEQIGRDVLLRIEKLEQLRADLQIGIDELDAGEGRELDLADVINEARREYGAEL